MHPHPDPLPRAEGFIQRNYAVGAGWGATISYRGFEDAEPHSLSVMPPFRNSDQHRSIYSDQDQNVSENTAVASRFEACWSNCDSGLRRLNVPDPFIKLLNNYGYQPIFAQRTGLEPPDVYAFVRKQLLRLGPLISFLNAPVHLEYHTGVIVDLEGRQTDKKSDAAASSFLSSALQALGFNASAGFKFAQDSDLVFTIKGVNFSSVDPVHIARFIESFSLPSTFPEDYGLYGRLHIAYEYAYSSTLQISRMDGGVLSGEAKALADVLDIKGNVDIKLDAKQRVTLTNRQKSPVAFAYKAARLTKVDDTWILEPGESTRSTEPTGAIKPFVLARGLVMQVVDQATQDISRSTI